MQLMYPFPYPLAHTSTLPLTLSHTLSHTLFHTLSHTLSHPPTNLTLIPSLIHVLTHLHFLTSSQFEEWQFMNSSVMPDKTRPESAYPDYKFATSAIEELQYLTTKEKSQYFMLSIGFKMPHTAYHVPHKYYDMYRSRKHFFQATPEQLRFPPTSPMISWRCCADRNFQYMNEEGSKKYNTTHMVQKVNESFPLSVHQELAWGYAALITFVDKQLGRVLDEFMEQFDNYTYCGSWDA